MNSSLFFRNCKLFKRKFFRFSGYHHSEKVAALGIRAVRTIRLNKRRVILNLPVHFSYGIRNILRNRKRQLFKGDINAPCFKIFPLIVGKKNDFFTGNSEVKENAGIIGNQPVAGVKDLIRVV